MEESRKDMTGQSGIGRFSFIALNQILERRARAEPEFRRELERRGKALLSDARALSDDALLAKLESFGISLDQKSYAEIAEHALSAEEISRTAITREVEAHFRTPFDSDWVWYALTILWERWFPQWPNAEQLDDRMQAGYHLLKTDVCGACEIWSRVWEDVRLMVDKGNFKTLAEFDDFVRGSQFVSSWVSDFEMEQGNAAGTDPKWHGRRTQFCEEALQCFPNEDQWRRENLRRGLAEGLFGAGQGARGDALYEQWLAADRQWGWGWIGWADNYVFTAAGHENFPRAEALLRQGVAVDKVRDREDILDRLASVCQKQGREAEAESLMTESQTIRAASQAVKKRISEEAFVALAEKIRRVDEYGEPGFEAVPPAAEPAISIKIGRNEPCPCGSGKKYKKCCLAKDEAERRSLRNL